MKKSQSLYSECHLPHLNRCEIPNSKNIEFILSSITIQNLTSKCEKTGPVAQSVECLLRGTGGHGFDPRLQHTKVIKNGTSCSSLGTQAYRVELGLVNPVSG